MFASEPLLAGEFAYPQQIGGHPRDEFKLFVHPCFAGRDDILPLFVAYQLVAMNYGDIAKADVAERFGATVLDIEVDVYYAKLRELVDGIA